jgi:hypothetical protein
MCPVSKTYAFGYIFCSISLFLIVPSSFPSPLAHTMAQNCMPVHYLWPISKVDLIGLPDPLDKNQAHPTSY